MDNNTYENEISLKELISILLKEKKLIIAVTLSFAILSAIYSFVILKPVYKADLTFTMHIPSEVQTKYGNYKPITTDSNDLITLLKEPEVIQKTIDNLNLEVSQESLINTINYSTKKDSKSVLIELNWNDPNEASKIIREHIDNYIDYIKYRYSLSAVNTFMDNIEKNKSISEQKIHSLKNSISYNENIFSSLDKYDVTAYNSLNNTKEGLLIAEVSNPSYIELKTEIVNQKKELNTLENNLIDYENFLKELQKEYKSLSENSSYIVSESTLNIMKNQIKIIKPAYAKSSPVKPNKKLNIAIAIVLGLMIGIFVAFFKNYWQNN